MTKERERLNFEWQRANNRYMALLTIIIFLTSFLKSFPPDIQIYMTILLSLSLSLLGVTIVDVNACELVYSFKGLRDDRKKVTKFKKYSIMISYLFVSLLGIIMALFGVYLLAVIFGVFPNPLNLVV